MSDEELERYLLIEKGISSAATVQEAEYERRHAEVVGLLKMLGPQERGDEDWMEEVLSRAHAQSEPHTRALISTVAAMAAAAALVLVLSPERGKLAATVGLQGLTTEVAGAAGVRGEATMGSVVTIKVPAAGPTARVRVYRDGVEMVAECLGTRCHQEGGLLSLAVSIDKPGRYQSIVFRGSRAAGLPARGLVEDLRAARSAGVVVELGDAIEVW